MEFTHVAIAFDDFHDIVVLHRVAFRAAVEMVFAFFGNLVDDDLYRLSDHVLGVFGGEFFLVIRDRFEPCAGIAFVHGREVHFHYRSAFFGAEYKSAQVVELHVLQKFHQLFKIFVRFTGEPDEHRTAERHARDSFADFVQKIDKFLFAVVALHVLEHLVACMLDRHVHVFHEARFLGHQVQKFIVHKHRVPIKHADPRNARVVQKGSQKINKRAAFFALFTSKVSRVLCNQSNFLDALGFEVLCLCYDVFDGTGILLAANQRDGAVGATAVTAFCNFQISVMAESTQVHAGEVLGVTALRSDDAHLLQKFARLVRADPVVHLGQFLHQLFAIAAAQAARNNQFLLGLLCFRLGENRVDGFFLGGFDEPARVHEDVVRLPGGITGHKTRMEHFADEVFCVDLVFCASEMHDKDFWLFCRHAHKYRIWGKRGANLLAAKSAHNDS